MRPLFLCSSFVCRYSAYCLSLFHSKYTHPYYHWHCFNIDALFYKNIGLARSHAPAWECTLSEVLQ